MIHEILIETSKKKQVINITSKINNIIQRNTTHEEGSIVLVNQHTSCCITTADLDEGTDQDYLKAIEEIFPKGNYLHPHDPSHVGDHIMSSLIGCSLNLIYKQKKLILGTWQEVVLIELNGPRKRKIAIDIL